MQTLAGTRASLQCNKREIISTNTNFLTNMKLNKVKKTSICKTTLEVLRTNTW